MSESGSTRRRRSVSGVHVRHDRIHHRHREAQAALGPSQAKLTAEGSRVGEQHQPTERFGLQRGTRLRLEGEQVRAVLGDGIGRRRRQRDQRVVAVGHRSEGTAADRPSGCRVA